MGRRTFYLERGVGNAKTGRRKVGREEANGFNDNSPKWT